MLCDDNGEIFSVPFTTRTEQAKKSMKLNLYKLYMISFSFLKIRSFSFVHLFTLSQTPNTRIGYPSTCKEKLNTLYHNTFPPA